MANAKNAMAVLGASEVAAAMEQNGIQAVSQQKKVILRAAQIIAAAMKELAPERTGALEKQIIVDVLKDEPGNIEVAIGPDLLGNAFYAHFQEFGTTHHAAEPFIRPAFDENVDRALDVAAAEVKKALKLK